MRAALGWRARDVERQSTAEVRFEDADRSSVVLADDPVQLVYADPAHGFTLPPGRYVRVIQEAGRVSAVSAAPQVDALPRERARALVLRLAALLEAAGWRRAASEDLGALADLPLEQALDRALGQAAARSSGFTGVAAWRAPRPGTPWAALPEGAPRGADVWDGLEVLVSVNTIDGDADGRPGSGRFVINVDVNDENLGRALSLMGGARRARLGDAGASLSSWDREPHESLARVPQLRHP